MGDPGSPQTHDLVEVRAANIRTDTTTDTHFLVLHDTGADRELLVAIGPSERRRPSPWPYNKSP